MNCKICLKEVANRSPRPFRHQDYHDSCLKRLFGNKNISPRLEFDKIKFETELAQRYSRRVSLSGIQRKLPIKIEGQKLVVTDVGGTHILKPASARYPGICENEHVSMLAAAALGIDVAHCGLVSFSDGELAYIVSRFDREGGQKIAQEDMCQIMARARDKEGNYKYDGSYEEAGNAILEATGKKSVLLRFIERLIFNYLIANGDWHLKNISLRHIERSGSYRELSPLYDAVNTRVHLTNESHDLALTDLFADRGFTETYDKWGYYTCADFKELARRLHIPPRSLDPFFLKLRRHREKLISLVQASYLQENLKQAYLKEMMGRFTRLLERDELA